MTNCFNPCPELHADKKKDHRYQALHFRKSALPISVRHPHFLPQRLRMTPSLSIPRTRMGGLICRVPLPYTVPSAFALDGMIGCGVTIKAVCSSRRVMELQSTAPCCSFWMVWQSAGGWACVKTALLKTQACSVPLLFGSHQGTVLTDIKDLGCMHISNVKTVPPAFSSPDARRKTNQLVVPKSSAS